MMGTGSTISEPVPSLSGPVGLLLHRPCHPPLLPNKTDTVGRLLFEVHMCALSESMSAGASLMNMDTCACIRTPWVTLPNFKRSNPMKFNSAHHSRRLAGAALRGRKGERKIWDQGERRSPGFKW